jgi:protein-S-isoprenylcysteine O-methyltransferase
MFFGDPGAGAADVAGFWIIFSAWVLGELWFQWKRRLPPGGTGADRGSMWLLIASVWIGLILGITAAAAVPSAAIATARHELFTGGLLIMAMGLALRWYAVATLGSAFTVRVGTAAGQTLIETGPFRCMRHPSYSGSLLTILGVLVCCGNFLSLLALALPLAGHAYRIRLEENVLVGALGDPYRRYMSRTKSLIPKLL